MRNLKFHLLNCLLLCFFLAATSNAAQAQHRDCVQDCTELLILRDSDCPCGLDLKEETVQLVGTIDPCHCHIFRTDQGIYVKKTQLRNGDYVIEMSRNLGAGATPRLYQVQAADTNHYINDLYIQIENAATH